MLTLTWTGMALAAAMEAVGRRDDAVALHVLTHLHKGNPRGQDALLRLEAGLGCCPPDLQNPDCDPVDDHQRTAAGLWSTLRPLHAAVDATLEADVDGRIDAGARPAGSHHSLTRTNSGELWMQLVKHSGGGMDQVGELGEPEDEPKVASAADGDGEGEGAQRRWSRQRRPWRPTLPGRQIHPLALRRRHLCRVYRAARWKLQRLLHKSKLRAWLSEIKGYNSPPRQVGGSSSPCFCWVGGSSSPCFCWELRGRSGLFSSCEVRIACAAHRALFPPCSNHRWASQPLL